MVLLPLRLFVGTIWLRAAAEKVVDAAWWDGSAVEAFVTTQITTGAVAARWCAWLAETVVVPNSEAVAWLIIVLQLLTGLAILLGIATTPFLGVGIAMNLSFLLMGAVNPSAFYIPMQVTLLMGDAGSVAGLERALNPDHPSALRRWHEAMFANARVWQATAGVLAIVAFLSILRMSSFAPAVVVKDPFAVLALVSGLAAFGALIEAASYAGDELQEPTTRLLARAGATQLTTRPFTARTPRPARDTTSNGNGRLRVARTPGRDEQHAADNAVLGARRSNGKADGHPQPPPSTRPPDDAPTGLQIMQQRQTAVRNYLVSLRDPDALRDETAIAALKVKIGHCDDGIERVRLRQQLLDLERPSLQPYEEAFVKHAKSWAEAAGVGRSALAAEGVTAEVLQRAGFRGAGRAVANQRMNGARHAS